MCINKEISLFMHMPHPSHPSSGRQTKTITKPLLKCKFSRMDSNHYYLNQNQVCCHCITEKFISGNKRT
jgi:hypothetical protein